MRKTLGAVALTLAVIGWSGSPALAQTAAAKTARGTVMALAADSVTVKVANVDMTFTVDGKTTVTAVGGGTKASAAQKAGMAGPKLGDVIKVGQAVSVSYHDMVARCTRPASRPSRALARTRRPSRRSVQCSRSAQRR